MLVLTVFVKLLPQINSKRLKILTTLKIMYNTFK